MEMKLASLSKTESQRKISLDWANAGWKHTLPTTSLSFNNTKRVFTENLKKIQAKNNHPLRADHPQATKLSYPRIAWLLA